MSTTQTQLTPDKQCEMCFYHALYHLVAHWAAYIAITGVLLVMIASLVAPQHPPASRIGRAILTCFFVFLLGGAWYFLIRMRRFGYEVNLRLPPPYVGRTDIRPRSFLGDLGGLLLARKISEADSKELEKLRETPGSPRSLTYGSYVSLVLTIGAVLLVMLRR